MRRFCGAAQRVKSIVNKIVERIRLKLWRRDQHINLKLRAYFKARYRIDVGLYSYGCFDQWRMPGPIRVGRYCSIANSVRSVPINHPYAALTTHPALYERKFGVVDQDIDWDTPLVIEDDVWIGHNVMLLPNCKHVGRGAIIGAGAIVTANVAPYAIVAGNPARLLRMRFSPELIGEIEASRWWEMSLAELGKLLAEQPQLVMNPNIASIVAWRARRPNKEHQNVK